MGRFKNLLYLCFIYIDVSSLAKIAVRLRADTLTWRLGVW